MEIQKLYLEMRDMLRSAGVPDDGFDADALLRHAVGRGRFDGGTVTPQDRERALALARRRAQREPLQYILGRWPFLELELEVGPGVLIPRPETEEVCLAAAALLEGRAAPTALDLCAGSGALALGLQSLVPEATITAVEMEEDACRWLARNIKAYAAAHPGQPSPTAVKADALRWHKTLADGVLDLITCNPPYVTEAEYATLAPELAHEPKQALVPAGGENDGLLFYREIAKSYAPKLRPGGWLVFETGTAQGAAVHGILEKEGYTSVQTQRDMSGHNRIALARRPIWPSE